MSSTPEPEEFKYVSAKCPKDHPIILKAKCQFCDEEEQVTVLQKLLALYEEMKISKVPKN